MYAMTGKLTVQPGQRQKLVDILLDASILVGALPECHQYLVCEDVSNDVTVWVFEVWDDKASHDASLRDEKVQTLISAARPLLAGAPDGAELNVKGGHGLVK